MTEQTKQNTGFLTQVTKERRGGIVVTIILVLLVVLGALFLPPISFADRLLTIGYETIDSNGGQVQLSDGARFTFPPEEGRADLRIKMDTVARASFLNGTTGDDLRTAAEYLPPGLSLQSPVYFIQSKDKSDIRRPVKLTIPVSDNTATPHALDIYTWTGDSWEWLPHRKISTGDVIEFELDSLPESVAVMHISASEPRISTDVASVASLPAEDAGILAELNPSGLYLDDDGQIRGEAAAIPTEPEFEDAQLAIVPVIRNWNEGNSSSSNPVDRVLTDDETRRRHAEAIVELVQSNGYQGIDLDYRRISPGLGQEYTALLTELRGLLPADKGLTVRVDLPQQLSTGAWDTGAYDWQAIGQIADVVKLPTRPDPKAYEAGGQMEAMLDRAVSRINRSKLQLLLRTGSVEVVDGQVHELSDQEAFELIGEVITLNSPAIIDPGQEVAVTLGGQPASTGIQVDDTDGTYWFAYLDEENRHHTIYLKNVSGFNDVLDLVPQYRLAGIAIQNGPGDANNTEIWDVVGSFLNETKPAVESRYAVAWQIQEKDGSLVAEEAVDLSNPNYRWTAPEAGGAFEVAASISSTTGMAPLPQGTVVILVATPTSTPTPTPTPSPTPSPTSTPTSTPTPPPEPTATPRPAQSAPVQSQPAAPPPPAVAPVNVPFGYGIQVDPRGDTAANIGHLKALGFNWVKFQMAWKDVEPAAGGYEWGMWDNIINAYSNNGIQVLLSIPKAPDWARPFDDDKSVEGPPQDPGLYAQFVATVADRYRGKAQAIEIWNEQNLWYEAGGVGRINAANYVQLLQLSYRAIKQVNPEMIVVSGALTPAGSVGEVAVDDIDYLNQMYANGAKGFFDALGAHPSGYNCPANADWRTVQDPTATSFRGPFDNRHHSWCFRGTMEGYREVMVANGDGNKAIIPTEFGWAVSGNPQPGYEYARDNSPEEQAQWIVEAYQLGQNWGWVGPMFLWNLDYGVTAAGTELANFAILNTPAYNALANMPK